MVRADVAKRIVVGVVVWHTYVASDNVAVAVAGVGDDVWTQSWLWGSNMLLSKRVVVVVSVVAAASVTVASVGVASAVGT